jgi:hypothetical protein
LDERVTMTLKLEVGDALDQKKDQNQGSSQEKSDINSSEGEKDFMTFFLDAGGLKVRTEDLKLESGETLNDEKKLGVKQRLFNLGYGPSRLDDWTDELFTDAVKRFQVHHKLSRTDGVIDSLFMEKLKEVHDTLPKTASAKQQ